jgi:3-hydroxybutyrate dehydrogenase
MGSTSDQRTRDGRVALVTGGAGGIGAACAERLAADGLSVAVVDRDRARGPAVATRIGGVFVAADLTDREDCRRAVEETVDLLGACDVLVNNAGFQHIDPLPDFPEAVWDRMLALMITAPFLLTKYAWPHLSRTGQGRVVNIGSAHSLVASPYKVGYVTAKHGMVGLMRVTAMEGGPLGITCNTVAPAYVRTPLVEGQLADQARTRGISPEEVEEQVFLAPAAVKRMLEPADVAGYVSYLVSEEAWGVTGSVATIDLGWTAN